MKKKILSGVVCSVICCSTLFATACGGGDGAGGKATLDFMYTGTQEILELFNDLVQEYNSTQGETDKVNVMAMPVASGGIDGKLTNVLPSSNGPDVVVGTDEYFKKHTKNMADLTGSFSADFLSSLYAGQETRYHYDAANITANSDDTLYGLPAVNDPTVLYYNKTALQAAGVICISVDAEDIDAFNAGTLADYNGKKKSDYDLTIDVPAKGYFRSNNPYVFDGSDYSGRSWREPTGATLVFNDRIAMSWDEVEDLGMLLTKSKNSNSTTDYGYYTEWWFNYAWSVGGDCLQDMNGKGDFTFSLPSTVPNYIVTAGNTYVGAYTGTTYVAGETLELADVINANVGDTIAYNSESDTDFYYMVNGAVAEVRADVESKADSGVLNQLPCTQEAFQRFCMLAGTGGLNVCPYPSAFNGTNSVQYFSSGVLSMLVQYYSNYKVIKDSSTFEWGIAPLPVYKEYASADPADDEVIAMGQAANHSLGYYVSIRKGTPIKEQSVKFITWLMTTGQAYAAQKGYVSAQKANEAVAIENMAKKIGKSSAMAVVESSAVSRAGDWWYMPDRSWIDNWANPLNQSVRYGTLSFTEYIYGYTEVSNRALKAYRN
jgi:ABC-type glycerol-3-phosphate transport system substrate-binding protein